MNWGVVPEDGEEEPWGVQAEGTGHRAWEGGPDAVPTSV